MSWPVRTTLIMGLLSCFAGFAAPAAAQRSCPGGPGPGERIVGVDKNNGLPLCAPAEDDGSSSGRSFADEDAQRDANMRSLVANISGPMSKKDMERIKELSRPGWRYSDPLKPPCHATYRVQGKFILIEGPSAENKSRRPTITLFTLDIPRPKLTRKGAPTPEAIFESGPTGGHMVAQRIKVVHRPVNAENGAYLFLVPSNAALLEGMKDRMTFKLSIAGKTMFDLSWTGGNAAKAKLARCLAGAN